MDDNLPEDKIEKLIENAKREEEAHFFDDLMETEAVTKEQVAVLQRMAGLGAVLIDWDIDYEVGRGILDGQDRCLWSMDGRRITANVSRDAFILSQADEPDPIYFQLKGGENDDGH